MKIISCEIWPVRLTLEEPFSIAYMTIDHTVNVFIRIRTDAGITGIGCAGHDQEVTGENEVTTERALRERAAPLLIGENPLSGAALMQRVGRALAGEPTACAAVDMALMDIAARKAGMPLWQFLGGELTPVTTSITIGIQPVAETLEKALEWKRRGFRILKIKGGNALEEDVEKIIRVREVIGPDMGLFFDANQGYTPEEALACITALDQAGALFIEQPCRKEELSLFSDLRKRSGGAVPIMADESALGPEDTLSLIRAGSADLYNIKLAKAGGIRRALAMDAVAAAGGYPTMMGSMDEPSLGIAAGLHTFLASSNCIYADLDGSLEFTDDLSHEAILLNDGQLLPRPGPGLGIDL